VFGCPEPRSRYRRVNRRFVRLATTVAVLLAGLSVGAVVWQAHHPSRRPNPSRQLAVTSTSYRGVRPPAPAPATTAPTTSPPSTSTTVDPGSLPQTAALPASDTAQFQSEMTSLWDGITHHSVADAMPSYFPEGAYLQLKTIANASGDYQNRLVHDFALDVDAANSLLGAGVSGATLVGVDVPSQFAHWVPPGVCDNSVGYFEVANSRLVYEEGGQTLSIGIASLISWRGVWYVVHLGAILRSSDAGIVLDPEAGPGASPPSSTC